MVLTYQQARSIQKPLPGGFPAGAFLGGLFFIVKFNGACLRPPIPRQFSGNKAIQLKYIDDSSKAASVNLKRSLTKYPVERPQPFNFHERFGTVLKPEENILQIELEKFHTWTLENKLLANTKKCFTMQFSCSRMFYFPLEFTLGNSEFLEENKSMNILGLMIQSNLGWDSTKKKWLGEPTRQPGRLGG